MELEITFVNIVYTILLQYSEKLLDYPKVLSTVSHTALQIVRTHHAYTFCTSKKHDVCIIFLLQFKHSAIAFIAI